MSGRQGMSGAAGDRIADELSPFSDAAMPEFIDDEARDNGGDPVRIVTLDEFADVDEPGADPLLGSPGEAVIPEGGDVMIYGDGGASKTTLSIDLAFHLAAGDDWLGLRIPDPCRVLLVEAEGPRPLFRAKLRAKRDAWKGSDIADRLRVHEAPWAQFRFPAVRVAEAAGELEVDVLIVGPLTRVGMDELGTLQQVRDFMGEVGRFRARTGRRLAVILLHHESKRGTVSGAWEGAGDTLIHATVHVRGKTKLAFQKARWSSKWHRQTLELDWADGEGFEVAEHPDRDLVAEIRAWLLEEPYSTAKEIATRKEAKRPDGTTQKIAGIAANETEVRDALESRQDIFRCRVKEEAKAVGRHPSAVIWEVREGALADPAHLGAPAPAGVGVGAGALVRPPYRAHQASGAPTPEPEGAPTDSAHLVAATPAQEALAARLLEQYGDEVTP